MKKQITRGSKRETQRLNIVHPYILNIKSKKPLSEILKPASIPFNITSIINGSPK